MLLPESIHVPGAGVASGRTRNTRHCHEDTLKARSAPDQTESSQGTRSRPRLVPAGCRNLRLWVVAAPPEDRLIRV